MFVDGLSNEELSELSEKIEEGFLKNYLQKRMVELANPMMVCPVCEKQVSEEEDLLIQFGPKGFRKKARFCGHDCLAYFFDKQMPRFAEKNILEKEE